MKHDPDSGDCLCNECIAFLRETAKKWARYGTQNGTSVEPDTDDPQNTGSKPEVKPKLFFVPHDSYPQE